MSLEMYTFAVGMIAGAAVVLFVLICLSPSDEEQILDRIESLDLTPVVHRDHEAFFENRLPEVVTKIDSPYNIAGRKRPERWSVRKKELEAESRQKRRHLESLRDQS